MRNLLVVSHMNEIPRGCLVDIKELPEAEPCSTFDWMESDASDLSTKTPKESILKVLVLIFELFLA